MNANPLQEAIEVAGGVAALARQIGVTSQAISQWERVPAERTLAVEVATGVSRYRLRPDVFGKEPPPAPTSEPTTPAAVQGADAA